MDPQIHPLFEFIVQLLAMGVFCGIVWLFMVLLISPVTISISTFLWITTKDARKGINKS